MEIDLSTIKVIGFDADDTLWINETYFREAEAKFATLLERYETKNKIDQELYKTEIKNLAIYGYGVKGFVLSMIETALVLSNNTLPQPVFLEILNLGKAMLQKPVIVLEGVAEVLKRLECNYRLIVLTKGDLLDQEQKLKKSKLSKYFSHVEVLSDKKEENYTSLLKHLQIAPANFLMIGNSLKSDVLPLVAIGAKAVHIPFHTTWQHEEVTAPKETHGYITLAHITDILKHL